MYAVITRLPLLISFILSTSPAAFAAPAFESGGGTPTILSFTAQGNPAINRTAEWNTTSTVQHYQRKLAVSLIIPNDHAEGCSMVGDGLIPRWCKCSLHESTGIANTCIGAVDVRSSDPSAPALPSSLIVQWIPTQIENGMTPGPVHAVCGYTGSSFPSGANGGRLSIPVVDHSNPSTADSGQGQQCGGFFIQSLGESRPYKTAGVDALPQSWIDLIDDTKSEGDISATLGMCMGGRTDMSSCSLQPIINPRYIEKRDATTVKPDISLEAGWITDAAKNHYNTNHLPMSLVVAFNSGLTCKIVASGFTTRWCHCAIDTNGLVNDCIALADVKSADPGAPALPTNMVVRWMPRGEKAGITQGLCGFKEDVLDAKLPSCDGFKFLNKGDAEQRNVAVWPAAYVTNGVDPAVALSLSSTEDVLKNRQKMSDCLDDQSRTKCPTPVHILPLEDPPFVKQDNKHKRYLVARDGSASTTTQKGNTLEYQAGWMTNAAKDYYKKDQFPLTLTVWYDASGATLCKAQDPSSPDTLTTKYCFCKLDPSTQLLDICAAMIEVTSQDQSKQAPKLPFNMFVRWTPLSTPTPKIITGICGTDLNGGSIEPDPKGDKRCQGFALFNFGPTNPDDSLMKNVAAWRYDYIYAYIMPQYALSWSADQSAEEIRDLANMCSTGPRKEEDKRKCPAQVPTLPVQKVTGSWKTQDNPWPR